jgi:hypothetical protein
MEDGLRLQPHTRAWLKQSALEAHLLGYCAYLASRGYAPSTRRVYLVCVAHFAHWMRREKLVLKRLAEDAVGRYLTKHLPRCDCPAPVRRLVHENRAALVHLLVTLRACGAVGEPRKPHRRIEAELEQFDGYMRRARGSPIIRGSNASRSFGISCPAPSAQGRLCRPGSTLPVCISSS